MSDRQYDGELYGDIFKISGSKIELAANILLVFDLREKSDWMQREADRMAGRSPFILYFGGDKESLEIWRKTLKIELDPLKNSLRESQNFTYFSHELKLRGVSFNNYKIWAKKYKYI
jgi:hypothetical protein